ncbi:hypothetical protein KW805_02730 [Candidatus Pacearchaeota archaeon]|nr:hypothetical protein [Candidatus Pacearchaeota archaeon]
MGVIEDIRRMQEEGNSEQDIIHSLAEQGVSEAEITDALTQSRIKKAVTENDYESSMTLGKVGQPQEASSLGKSFEGMQPSMMNIAPPEPGQEYVGQPYQQQQQYQQTYVQETPGQQQQQQYDYAYQPNVSTDTISEISEQIVSERLFSIKKELEKTLDMKMIFESKIDFIDERLKRIEKIIDRLQLSILQKVGEYTTNIEDIKKELVETQKSFKSLHGKHK